MIAKTTPGTAGGRRVVGGGLIHDGQARSPERADPSSHNERVRLITFVWSGRTGDQPVIFADRSWLQ
jgi:hypothetical protein